MTARTPQRQQLIDLLTPVIAAEGYDLEDLSVTAAGRRSLIRITVDADNGIDLDGVAAVSRSISTALDDDTDGGDAAFAGPYVLEVSSPGVDRPLTEPRHWRRAAGRLVEFPVTERAGSHRVVTGRVKALEGSDLVVDVAGTEQRFALDTVGSGRVQVEFSRPGQQSVDSDGELALVDSDGLDDDLDDDSDGDQLDEDSDDLDDDSDLNFDEDDEPRPVGGLSAASDAEPADHSDAARARHKEA